jgi:hypothetical protein
MPTNHYFSKGTVSEQLLYEDLAIEAIQIYGHDVYYLPRTMVNKDELFGESPLSKFTDAYMVEMYMDTNEGYEGEKEIISRFGLEIRDETTFTVSRRRWLDLVSSNSNLISALRPNEGDWIYMPTVGRLLEISFVDKDDPFYQLDNLPVYKLFTRTVEYSSEDLDTGIEAIDAIETERSTDAYDWQILGEQTARATLYNCKIELERGTDIYADGVIILNQTDAGGANAGSSLTGESETNTISTTLNGGVVTGAQNIILTSTASILLGSGADNAATGSLTIHADQNNAAETVVFSWSGVGNEVTLQNEIGLNNAHHTGARVTIEPHGDAIFDAILMEDSDDYYSFFVINEDYSLATSDPLSDNTWIEEAVTGTGEFSSADAVLDFTEKNPFGEPSETI